MRAKLSYSYNGRFTPTIQGLTSKSFA